MFVDGVKVSKGAAVRLHPERRADAWDMFLHDEVATSRHDHHHLKDVLYVTITVDDDPASDLRDWYGRSFFFYPDEIEPLGNADDLLVAGIGNVFFSDDGFGPEVAHCSPASRGRRAKVEDFGICGLHLAYELLAGYERAILIDAVPRGGAPGTLYVIEPGRPARGVPTPTAWTCSTCSLSCACWRASRRRSPSSAASPGRPSPGWASPPP